MAVCSLTISFFFVILMEFWYLSHAYNYTFYVGENDGWTFKPSENHSHWAERHRFQINDELVFKYKKGNDSVLVVSEHDYYKCNKYNPIKTFEDGESRFKFDRSGSFFFISGHDQNCEKGQKLIVVVLSDHHRNTHNPPSQPPETPLRPHSSPPSPVKPPSHSPSPTPVPGTPTHAPPVEPPSHSPTPSPAAAKIPAHAPPVQPPSHSPSPSTRREASVPLDRYALPPHAHPPVFPPHHAPAPAPSSASGSGGSFVLLVGLSLVEAMISAGFV